jgi:sialate O-acetylesterase
MANWRRQCGGPDLPFLIVGLAGWGPVAAKPTESGWAALINEQRLAAERDPRAALVSAIDLGDPADIHPANKQEIGRRLALAGKSLVYGSGGKLGPMPLRVARAGDTITVTFTKPLQTLSAAQAIAFEICDSVPNSCRYADARAEGNRVILKTDSRRVTRVRYAWADYPIVNLYDLDLLPAPVFELPVE